MLRLAIIVVLFACPLATAQVPKPVVGFRLPPGYEITEYADSTLANDIISMTLDPKGRIVVSGRDYIRILIDENNGGRATKAIDFAREPKSGAHGLLWEKETVYFVGDGGLRKLTCAKNSELADGPSTLIRTLNTGSEHGAHAIRRSPDGWLYLIGGDHAGIDATFAQLPTSPITNPVGGCVVRFHPESWKSEIVAHGLRNPYGMDFDAYGRLFTFDSDNERCVGLPWYEPTRFYHVVPGGFYGWLTPQKASFLQRLPPHAVDVIPPVTTHGRGSPTFVLHWDQGTPESDHATFLIGDWTFGKVHQTTRLFDLKGSKGMSKLFLESTGENGFAPTAAVRHPKTGDLFIAIGGRGTRGAVYRVRSTNAANALNVEQAKDAGKLPFCSLELGPNLANEVARDAVSPHYRDRLWALERIDRFKPQPHGKSGLFTRQFIPDEVVAKAIEANWTSDDRYLINATARIMAKHRLPLTDNPDIPPKAYRAWLLARVLNGVPFDLARAALLLKSDDSPLVVDIVCLLQRRLGLPRKQSGAWEAYAGSVSPEDREALTIPLMDLMARADKGSWELRHESARLFGLVAPAQPATRLLGWLSPQGHPVDQFHLLAALAQSSHHRNETKPVADILLHLDRGYEKSEIPRESNWPVRLGELVEKLMKRDPDLADEMLNHPEFGRPEHALFANLRGFDRPKAAAVFLKRVQDDKTYPLNGKTLTLLAEIKSDDLVSLVRPYWGRGGLDEALLPILARVPLSEDRPKFVAGLKSLQANTVSVSLKALGNIKHPADDAEIANLLIAWDQTGPKQKDIADDIVARLQTASGQSLGPDRSVWQSWLTKTHPKIAQRFAQIDNVDRAAWQKRLDAIDWTKGTTDTGKIIFAKASCAACHAGAQTIGPDLAGITSRFHRDDLFTAILQPNKDVADRYRVLQVVTHEGKVHQGLIVYDAFDGLILRTSPTDTVRIAGNNIESRSIVSRSLMPAGLLDTLSDADLANLFAYLRSQGKTKE